VGLERAHAEFVRQGEGLPVVGFGLREIGRVVVRRDLTKEAQGIRLVTPLLVLQSERQRPLGKGMCPIHAAS
jgi:hypothetical protein